MLAHLRTEAYLLYATRRYPPARPEATPRLSYEENLRRIATAKASLATQAAPSVGTMSSPHDD